MVFKLSLRRVWVHTSSNEDAVLTPEFLSQIQSPSIFPARRTTALVFINRTGTTSPPRSPLHGNRIYPITSGASSSAAKEKQCSAVVSVQHSIGSAARSL